MLRSGALGHISLEVRIFGASLGCSLQTLALKERRGSEERQGALLGDSAPHPLGRHLRDCCLMAKWDGVDTCLVHD